MTEPSTRRTFIHHSGQLQVLGARPVVLGRVELGRAIRRGDHVSNLIVSILPQLERVPAVALQHRIPAGSVHVCRRKGYSPGYQDTAASITFRPIALTSTGIHHTSIADDEAVLRAGARQIEERIFYLNHRLQQVLLELDGVLLGQISKLHAAPERMMKEFYL